MEALVGASGISGNDPLGFQCLASLGLWKDTKAAWHAIQSEFPPDIPKSHYGDIPISLIERKLRYVFHRWQTLTGFLLKNTRPIEFRIENLGFSLLAHAMAVNLSKVPVVPQDQLWAFHDRLLR